MARFSSSIKFPRSRGAILLAEMMANGITHANIYAIFGKKTPIAMWISGRLVPSNKHQTVFEKSCGIPKPAWKEIVDAGNPASVAAARSALKMTAHQKYLTRSHGAHLLGEFLVREEMSGKEFAKWLPASSDETARRWKVGLGFPNMKARILMRDKCGIALSAWKSKKLSKHEEHEADAAARGFPTPSHPDDYENPNAPVGKKKSGAKQLAFRLPANLMAVLDAEVARLSAIVGRTATHSEAVRSILIAYRPPVTPEIAAGKTRR